MKTAAWAVPAIVLMKAVPAAAASGLGTITVVSTSTTLNGPGDFTGVGSFTLSKPGPALLESYFTFLLAPDSYITSLAYTDAPTNTAFTLEFFCSGALEMDIDIPGFYPLTGVGF